jgi:hypothetical protein
MPTPSNDIFEADNQRNYEDQYYLNNFRPQFDSNNYRKPDPFYGFVHDQYIVSSNNNGGKKDNKKAYPNQTNTNQAISNNKNPSEKR